MKNFFHNLKVAFKDLDSYICSDSHISKKAKIFLLTIISILTILYISNYIYIKMNESSYSDITVLVNNKQYDLAHKKLESLLKKNPNDPYYLILAARVNVGISDTVSDARAKRIYLNDALSLLKKAEEIDSGLSEIYKTRGVVHVRTGELYLAEFDYKQVTNLDNKSSMAWVDLGDVYVMEYRISEAIESYSKALFLDPNNEYAMLGNVKILVLQNNFDKVLNLALHVYGITTDKSVKLQLAGIIGNAYSKLTKYPEALYYLNEGLKLDPLSVYINYGLAEVAFYSNFNFEKPTDGMDNVKDLVDRVIKLDPSYPYSYALLTRIAESVDNKSDYDKYLQMTKDKMNSYPSISSKEKNIFLATLPLYNKSSSKVTVKVLSAKTIKSGSGSNILISK